MPARIDNLTPEQIAMMPAWVSKWIANGLSCEPADWETFEREVVKCYGHANLLPPKRIVRVGSPLVVAIAGPVAAALLDGLDSTVSSAVRNAMSSDVGTAIGSAVRNAVISSVSFSIDSAASAAVNSAVNSAVVSTAYDAVLSSVSSGVDSAVGSAVDSAIGSAVDDAVGSAVDAAVGSAVRNAVISSVSSSVDSAVGSAVNSAVGSAAYDAVLSSVSSGVDSAVGSAVRNAVRDALTGADVGFAVRSEVVRPVPRYIGGCFWAAWSAYESFFHDVCGLDLGDISLRAKAYRSAQMSVGWWCPYKDFVIVSDRPREINRNARGALHCESGPSIAWRDGWKLWHIDGLRVDEQIVMRPETQTIAQIDSETNNDIRAVRMERFGVARYMTETGATVLDECANAIEGTHEALLRTARGEVFLWPTCPSGRICPPLRVPAVLRTCEEARNWLGGERWCRVVART